MTWITKRVGGYEGHFIDGYFRAPDAFNSATGARQQELTQTDLLFGAVIRLYPNMGTTNHEGLAREFRRYTDDAHCARTLITRRNDHSHRFVNQLVQHAHFEVKPDDTYADLGAYTRDVNSILDDLLAIYATPIDVSTRILQRAGMNILAVMTPREKP